MLSAWNQEAGYGTIRPLHGGDEVFVGLGAFPTDGEGPRLDERLSFEIVSGRDGRKQAVNLQRLRTDRAAVALREASGAGQARLRQAQRKRRLARVGGAVVAMVLVVGGVQMWHPEAADRSVKASR